MKKKLVSLLLVLAMARPVLQAVQEILQAQAIPRSSPGKHRENPNLFLPPPQIFKRILPRCAAIKRRMRKRSTK